MPDDADLIAQVVRECSDPNGTIAPIAATVWHLYEDVGRRHPDLGPRLQTLYTRRALLDIRLAEEQQNTSFGVQGDLSDQQSDRFAHVQQMRADTQAEIVRWEALMQQSAGAASGCLAATELSRPPSGTGFPDAASSVYRGSPYYRPVRPT